MKIMVLLLIFVALVFADKALTFANLSVTRNDNPDTYLDAERNPAARWFFEKCGLFWGSVLFGIVTMCSLSFMYYLFQGVLGGPKTLWFIMIVYGLVLGNNTYYLLQNTKII